MAEYERGFSAASKINELKAAANDGNAEAMYWLGYKYYYGEDVDDNEDLAELWVGKAKDLGYSKAMLDYEKWFSQVPDEEFVINAIDQQYPLKSLFDIYDSLIVVDTETSGLDSKNNRVIELAAIKIVAHDGNAEIVDELDEFIKLPEGVRLDPKITELTGITEEQLEKEGKSSHEVFTNFVNMFAGETTLFVAYNAQFDLGFIYWSLVREQLKDKVKVFDKLDALTIYKDRAQYPHRLENAIENYNLQDVVVNSHRAIDDTKALVEVIKAMDYQKSDLHKYINLFGYNPKYGVNGAKFTTVKYKPQPYNSYKSLYE